MDLNNYVNEIIDIAEANGMGWDIGKDMFLANIQNSGVEGEPHYPGAYVDYPALKLKLEAMTLEEVAEMSNAFDEWYRENLVEIVKARSK